MAFRGSVARRTSAGVAQPAEAPPAPPPTTLSTYVSAGLEIAIAASCLALLAGDLGTVRYDYGVTGVVLGVVAAAVAFYSWVTGVKQRIWGPSIDGMPASVTELVLLALGAVSVALMGAVHPALGMVALQGFLAAVFIGGVRRSIERNAPRAIGCMVPLAVGYGALLLALGFLMYNGLRDDPTRDFPLGASAFFTLMMPGIRTLLIARPG